MAVEWEVEWETVTEGMWVQPLAQVWAAAWELAMAGKWGVM